MESKIKVHDQPTLERRHEELVKNFNDNMLAAVTRIARLELQVEELVNRLDRFTN